MFRFDPFQFFLRDLGTSELYIFSHKTQTAKHPCPKRFVNLGHESKIHAMKRIPLFLVVCAITSIAWSRDAPPPERKELNELLESVKDWKSEVAVLQGLPPEKKQRYIAFTRKELSTEKSPTGRNAILRTLYILGDADARDELVKNFYRDGANRTTAPQAAAFLATGDPEVIPMLASALRRVEPYQRFGDDAFTYPLSFQASTAIIGIVQNSRAFNLDVMSWAGRLLGEDSVPTEELREIVREWWRANEAFFQQKNYMAVQPGRKMRPEPQR